jgi:hypothetical protein
MNDEIIIKLTKDEFFILLRRFQSSLEKDSTRGEDIDQKEFDLLTKLIEYEG